MSNNASSTDRRALLAGIGGLAAGTFLTAGRVEGGPVVPPGPPAPSGKALTELEPRTAVTAENAPGDATAVHVISESGSYYLAGNIVVPSGKAGIRIVESNVTLDLNGFSITGLGGGAGGSLGGVSDDGQENTLTSVVVRNGMVTDTGGVGIALGGTELARVEDVIVRNNRREGIIVAVRSQILRATVNSNSLTAAPQRGVALGEFSSVIDSLVASNFGTGIVASHGCMVSRSIVRGNTSHGITGFNGMSISNCTVTANSLDGISVEGNALIESTACYQNSGIGFVASFAAVMKNCVARANNGGGFVVAEGSNLVGCCAAYNTNGVNTAHGFVIGQGTVVTDCTSTNNAGYGFHTTGSIAANSGCVIAGCTARANATYGINITSGCYVHDCACSLNAVKGIYTEGNDNRIERNNCVSGTWGIHVLGSGNVITANTCSGNSTNWNIAGNNIYGPVINRVSPASLSMAGNGSVDSTMGSSDPYANFSY